MGYFIILYRMFPEETGLFKPNFLLGKCPPEQVGKLSDSTHCFSSISYSAKDLNDLE